MAEPLPDDLDLAQLAAAEGRFSARPGAGSSRLPALPAGLHPLGLRAGRDGVRYVPPGLDPARPAPLVLALHGATGSGDRAVQRLLPLAEERGIVVVAPDSRGRTWDVLMGGYGPDVYDINAALDDTFARCTIDPARVAIEGFSDGASYALSLGIANGDLFTHILAFSPGFAMPPGREGEPAIFVSHGTRDQVLPINHCSRVLVPALRQAGYAVRYEEFDGPHTVPPEIVAMAVDLLLQ